MTTLAMPPHGQDASATPVHRVDCISPTVLVIWWLGIPNQNQDERSLGPWDIVIVIDFLRRVVDFLPVRATKD